jgi:hypothetical protein
MVPELPALVKKMPGNNRRVDYRGRSKCIYSHLPKYLTLLSLMKAVRTKPTMQAIVWMAMKPPRCLVLSDSQEEKKVVTI